MVHVYDTVIDNEISLLVYYTITVTTTITAGGALSF